MMQIKIRDFRTRLPKQLKCAQSGEEVVIAIRGQPITRLVWLSSAEALSRLPGNSAALSS
jgi:antitoxin (DNA-binding transcriptional repressor) of toxin-antitoxin stability system